jgi:hypothetical protein
LSSTARKSCRQVRREVPSCRSLALGRPDLPPLSALVRGLPTRKPGRAGGFDRRVILDSADAVGDRWRVLANVPWEIRPYFALGNSHRGGAMLLVRKKPDAALRNNIWIDDSFDYWSNNFADLYDDRSAIAEIDRLLDVAQNLGREDAQWPLVQLEELVAYLAGMRTRLAAGEHLTRENEQAWVELPMTWGAEREFHDVDIYRLGQTYSMPASSLDEYPPGEAFAEIAAKHTELSVVGMENSRIDSGPTPEFFQLAAEFRALRPLGWEANASKITATSPGILWDEIRSFDSDFYDFLRWDGARRRDS